MGEQSLGRRSAVASPLGTAGSLWRTTVPPGVVVVEAQGESRARLEEQALRASIIRALASAGSPSSPPETLHHTHAHASSSSAESPPHTTHTHTHTRAPPHTHTQANGHAHPHTHTHRPAGSSASSPGGGAVRGSASDAINQQYSATSAVHEGEESLMDRARPTSAAAAAQQQRWLRQAAAAVALVPEHLRLRGRESRAVTPGGATAPPSARTACPMHRMANAPDVPLPR
ncbi:hypothetical protein T484DRAFT_2509029 [Baffinella frigidus]|nr:hypothetical protein T484DRAFT_2509029 [Cryptophyta sp. CCMP2293]